MHYSRVMPVVGGQRYHTSTSVFLNEVIKLAVSLSMVCVLRPPSYHIFALS
jgi:hypothetical protein